MELFIDYAYILLVDCRKREKVVPERESISEESSFHFEIFSDVEIVVFLISYRSPIWFFDSLYGIWISRIR